MPNQSVSVLGHNDPDQTNNREIVSSVMTLGVVQSQTEVRRSLSDGPELQ